VGTRKPTKRALLREYLDRTGPEIVDEARWQELLALLAPVSEGYLRKLLRSTEFPLSPLVEGVVQDTIENLDRTLLAMAGEYQRAAVARDPARMARCRRLVITAKDHARWAATRSGPLKKEMVEILLVWLENPDIFEIWLRAKHKTARL
jgi:hypothetical protein